MKKVLEVLKRELQHVEYLLDPKAGWVVTEVVSRIPGNREARIAMKEHANDSSFWDEAFWSFEDLDDKIQASMIVAGEWWEDGTFKIEEAYTQEELAQLKSELEAAILDLEAPRFIEVRTTGGQTLSPVIVRDLKEAVLSIHEEMDADYDPFADSATIYGAHGEVVYRYTPASELTKYGMAEYIAEHGQDVIQEKDRGDVILPMGYGPRYMKIFPVKEKRTVSRRPFPAAGQPKTSTKKVEGNVCC